MTENNCGTCEGKGSVTLDIFNTVLCPACLGDVKWCATEDGSQGKGTGRHIACFVLRPKCSALAPNRE